MIKNSKKYDPQLARKTVCAVIKKKKTTLKGLFFVLTWHSHFLWKMFGFSQRPYVLLALIRRNWMHFACSDCIWKCKGGAVRCWHDHRPAVRSLFLIHVGDWHTEFCTQFQSHQPDGVLQDKVSGLYHIITPSAVFIVSFFTCWLKREHLWIQMAYCL